MKTIYGIKGFAMSEFAISANAELGIRDSGKTYAGCEAAEELYDYGVPSICFDPIGKWHSLRVPGRGKGYPFVVAGGKFGDLPLTRKNAGPLVRAAMKDGVSLVLDLFSREMSKADWRYIVQEACEILLHENEDHGLRHVFIEEAGEFVPQKVRDGNVFAAVESLVRMGGNSKLGCTLIHQRPADINKSVLELCANVLLLRQSGRRTLMDLKKWLDMVSEDQAQEIADSLPGLKSGEGWLFAHTLRKVVRFQVPQRNSKHPDRRETTDAGAEASAARKAISAEKFVDAMKAALVEKPKVVSASKPVAKINMAPDTALKDREAAFSAGAREGQQVGFAEGWLVGHAAGFKAGSEKTFREVVDAIKMQPTPFYTPPAAPKAPKNAGSVAPPPAQRAATVRPAPLTSGHDTGLSRPQAKILESLAWWAAMGHTAPTRAQTAIKAGMKARGGHFKTRLSELSGKGYVTYPNGDQVSMTEAGAAAAPAPDVGQTIVATVRPLLSSPQAKIFDAMLAGHHDRSDIATEAGMDANGGHFKTRLSELSSFEIVEYPDKGSAKLQDWVTSVSRTARVVSTGWG